MREIKFRGLSYNCSLLKDVWRYGGLTENKKGYSIRSKDHNGYYGYFIKRTETIGQYTGLKDKNGKEIHEDDIITYEESTIKFQEIVKINNGLITPFYEIWSGQYMIESYGGTIEIIGNIHENPELIEG